MILKGLRRADRVDNALSTGSDSLTRRRRFSLLSHELDALNAIILDSHYAADANPDMLSAVAVIAGTPSARSALSRICRGPASRRPLDRTAQVDWHIVRVGGFGPRPPTPRVQHSCETPTFRYVTLIQPLQQ